MAQTSSPSQVQVFGLKLACAGTAGLVGASLAYPLDMAKTRLQAQRTGQFAAPGSLYRGVGHCIYTVGRVEGPRAIYKGLFANLVGVFPEKAIKLGVNDFVRSALADENGNVSILSGCLAGGTAGLTQVVATNPMEIVKVQQQKPVNKAETTVQTFRRLWFRKLYHGAPATLIRDIPFSVIYFGLYGYLEQTYATDPITGEKNFPLVLASGLFAGMVGAFTSTPSDVIKTRLQLENAEHSRILPQARAIWAEEGFRAFLKGAWPRCAAIGTLFAIAQASFVVQKDLMARHGWA